MFSNLKNLFPKTQGGGDETTNKEEQTVETSESTNITQVKGSGRIGFSIGSLTVVLGLMRNYFGFGNFKNPTEVQSAFIKLAEMGFMPDPEVTHNTNSITLESLVEDALFFKGIVAVGNAGYDEYAKFIGENLTHQDVQTQKVTSELPILYIATRYLAVTKLLNVGERGAYVGNTEKTRNKYVLNGFKAKCYVINMGGQEICLLKGINGSLLALVAGKVEMQLEFANLAQKVAAAVESNYQELERIEQKDCYLPVIAMKNEFFDTSFLLQLTGIIGQDGPIDDAIGIFKGLEAYIAEFNSKFDFELNENGALSDSSTAVTIVTRAVNTDYRYLSDFNVFQFQDGKPVFGLHIKEDEFVVSKADCPQEMQQKLQYYPFFVKA